ncbi:MAG: preprotein translocase subunit SecA [Mycoplasmatales bacterium]
MLKILNKIFDQDKKYINKYESLADQVMNKEEEVAKLSDEQLQAKTAEFKERIKGGATLEELKVEVFAVVREASKRAVGLFPFKVQVMGAFALSEGNIAEMKTGEGKTLTAAMPTYLYALEEKGAHVVTVNEYLAERDSNDIGRIFNFLGLEVGLIKRELSFDEKKKAYQADITYVTNSELGFDYLRDNMALSKEQRVIRGLYYALVDEVDSILIDEARTPLIISGQEKKTHNMYAQVDTVVKTLEEEVDFKVNLQDKVAHLKPEGINKIEKSLSLKNLFNIENSQITHAINQSLKANYCMEKDVDYVVSDERVVIVDQFTGRTMEGRVFSDGLHQAIEAKEYVKTQKETKTLATITYQNFFRVYETLSGMTGTAKTEEEEIQKIYDMDVVVIPTNKPVIRKDRNDLIFRTNKAKYSHMISLIKERHDMGQPILIGTVAIETSEEISSLLNNLHIKHNVLNAKHHMQEANIIAQAGHKGAITIATNMAGRGTDIKIAEEVKELPIFKSKLLGEDIEPSGLLVVGTERHDSRRIDNQLRGRSGRQGDVGESIFYVSFEDTLARKYMSDGIRAALQKISTDEVISSRVLTNSIQKMQKKVESINFDSRQNVLKYDDVLREQRELVYGQRDKILFEDNGLELVNKVIENYLIEQEQQAIATGELQEVQDMVNRNMVITPVEINLEENILEQLKAIANAQLNKKIEEHGENVISEFAKAVMIKVIDTSWVNHIDDMQILRESIGLRGYGQTDPLQEYQKEGREMFDNLMLSIEREIVKIMLKGTIQGSSQREAVVSKMKAEHAQATAGNQEKHKTFVNDDKVGRNDPCPCGSGLKYKNCHGK